MAIIYRNLIRNRSLSGDGNLPGDLRKGSCRNVQFSQEVSANGGSNRTVHLFRLISQPDWGHAELYARIYRSSYQPSSISGGLHRLRVYYSGYTWEHLSGGDYSSVLQSQTFGPGGALQIHAQANGGYWRDAWGRDYYMTIGGYGTYQIDYTIIAPGGFMKDRNTPLTTIYPASFGSTASQSDADSWNYGRGFWFNVPAGSLENI